MDSGKDFLFWHSFPLFWPQNLAVFGVIASFPESGFHRWEIPKSGFYRGTDQFSNARMMASCSGQLFRKSGSIKLEPEFRKINTAKQWSGKMQWTIFPKLGFYRVGTPISENWPDGLLGPTKLRLSGDKVSGLKSILRVVLPFESDLNQTLNISKTTQPLHEARSF